MGPPEQTDVAHTVPVHVRKSRSARLLVSHQRRLHNWLKQTDHGPLHKKSGLNRFRPKVGPTLFSIGCMNESQRVPNLCTLPGEPKSGFLTSQTWCTGNELG